MDSKLGWSKEDHDKDQQEHESRQALITQVKAAKVSVQLAMEMCGFKSRAGACLNMIWEELHMLVESIEEGEL